MKTKTQTHTANISVLIARLDRIASNDIYPPKVRVAAKRDADGYRDALRAVITKVEAR